MTHLDNCQIPGYQRIAEGEEEVGLQSPARLIKRLLARPWNYEVKPMLKRFVRWLYAQRANLLSTGQGKQKAQGVSATVHLQAGDWVRVRDKEEIKATLDPFKEYKGCAFLDYMWQYCGTTQRVLQPVEQFLDERDYKVKKARGVVLLEGVLCHGTPVFGRCDRCCHLFWREEWLEKIENHIG